MLYYLAASALGAGWAAILSVPGLTGQWIRLLPNWNVALLILASIVVARLFKNWISEGGSVGSQVGRAIVITYVGCVVYLTFLNLLLEVQSLRFGAAEGLRDWLGRYYWGTIAAVYASYVVVPFGIFCQLALNRISRMNGLTNEPVATPGSRSAADGGRDRVY